MRNHLLDVRAPAIGACFLLALAACGGSHKTRAPGAGTGSDLIIAMPPGSFSIRRVEVVGIAPDELPPPDADVHAPAPQPSGMMPPRLEGELRIETDRVTHLDGLDLDALLRGDEPDVAVNTYHNVIDGRGVTFDLQILDADGATRRVRPALTKASADLLVGLLRYETVAAKTGALAGGTYRVELDRRAD